MKNKLLTIVFIAIFLYSTQVVPMISYCDTGPPKIPTPLPTLTPSPTPTQSPTPKPTPTPTVEPEGPEITPGEYSPRPTPNREETPNFLFIGEAILGVAVVVGIGVSAFVFVKKRRMNERNLRRLSSSEFQNWVLKRLNGKPSSSRDSDMGIDGFATGGQPVSIKQSDDVGMRVIDSFASALARNKVREGVIVAFSFGSDAIRGKVRAKTNYGLEIQMLTVDELIYNKRAF
jgi:hypothetical protein